jgi:hypothetical protein
MNFNFLNEFVLMYHHRLLSYAGFFVFIGILAGLYFLITRKMKPGIRAVFNIFITVILFISSVIFFFDMTTSLITIYQVNHQLGFSYATPETPDGEILEIQRVRKGKTMDKAGLKIWDRVLMNNVNDLYRLLIANQGKEIIIPVLRENEKLEIKVIVPELNVPLAKVSFMIM